MAVRFIDLSTCIGCGTCIETCPMDVFRLDTIAEKRPESSPCSIACPLGLQQREYHNLIKMNQMNEAAALLQIIHPMPAITGRICPHPCESECTRNQVDEAVNINGLEQYLGDYLLKVETENYILPQGDKVAVIGSGPAGLSAAYFLTLSGYQVTVFEKEEKAGGLLRYAIPAFRLGDEVLDKQLDIYKKMGVTFKTGVTFGKDVTKDGLTAEGFKAFVGATGASKALGLNVPGSDAGGIISAMDFLKDSRVGNVKVPSKVAVIGGGSVSLDTARTAKRLGADEVHIISLEKLEPGTKDSMLALESEIKEAVEEGIKMHPSLGVESFKVASGKVASITCVECLKVRDEDGSFNPEYGGCVDLDLDVEMVILAIGQTADATLVPAEFKTTAQGFITADADTLQVESELFGAGDAVTGPSTVVKALASGKQAAEVINRYLKGEKLTIEAEVAPARADGLEEGRVVYTEERMIRCNQSADLRVKSFNETVECFSDKTAMREAGRCLTCGSRSKIAYMDDCQVCRLCEHYCPTDSIEITDGAMMSSLHLFDVVKLGKALD